MAGVTGGEIPTAIWKRFMLVAEAGKPPQDFAWLQPEPTPVPEPVDAADQDAVASPPPTDTPAPVDEAPDMTAPAPRTTARPRRRPRRREPPMRRRRRMPAAGRDPVELHRLDRRRHGGGSPMSDAPGPAWIPILASATSVVIAVVTAVFAQRAAQSASQKADALEALKARLQDETAEKNAFRDYRYDALKHLYEEVQPLLFQLRGPLQQMVDHTQNLARAARSGDLDPGPDNWIRDPYTGAPPSTG